MAGIGLHTGCRSVVRIEPAFEYDGLQYAAVGQRAVLARAEAVTDTRLGTTLGAGRARMRTVEHWLAALTGCGVDNAVLRLVHGDELPILDGSAAPIVTRVMQVGLVEQASFRRWLVVRRPVVVDGPEGAQVRLEPAEGRWLQGTYAFASPVGVQSLTLELTPAHFRRALAPARTFAFADDVARLRRTGRAHGGSLDNAVVFAPDGPVNPDGLRFSDEVARHKLLDAVGDLALLGGAWQGRYVADRGGHALNVALVLKALTTPGALRWSASTSCVSAEARTAS